MDEETFFQRLNQYPPLKFLKGEQHTNQKSNTSSNHNFSLPNYSSKESTSRVSDECSIRIQSLRPGPCLNTDTIADLKDVWKAQTGYTRPVRCVLRGAVLSVFVTGKETLYIMPSLPSQAKRSLPFNEDDFWPKLKIFCEITYGEARAASMMQTFKKLIDTPIQLTHALIPYQDFATRK
eukprot:gene4998-6948_t